jgi:hypothetical protein
MREWFDGDGSWPSEMFDREENGREPPYGPALDLGTGSGIWGYNWQSGRLCKPMVLSRISSHGP